MLQRLLTTGDPATISQRTWAQIARYRADLTDLPPGTLSVDEQAALDQLDRILSR
jgi:hypothetical protein